MWFSLMSTAAPSGTGGWLLQAAAKERANSDRSVRFMVDGVRGLESPPERRAPALSAEARESWSAVERGLLPQLLDQLGQILTVGLHVHLVDDLTQDALLVDHEGDALGVLAGGIQDTVLGGHSAVRIREQGEG